MVVKNSLLQVLGLAYIQSTVLHFQDVNAKHIKFRVVSFWLCASVQNQGFSSIVRDFGDFRQAPLDASRSRTAQAKTEQMVQFLSLISVFQDWRFKTFVV